MQQLRLDIVLIFLKYERWRMSEGRPDPYPVPQLTKGVAACYVR
jgi:hypothetical protein